MTIWAILLLLLWQAGAAPLAPVVPPPQKQIAAALLPLPLNLREGAGVRGYDRDLKLITLRASRNGIIYARGFGPTMKSLMSVAITSRFFRWSIVCASWTGRAWNATKSTTS